MASRIAVPMIVICLAVAALSACGGPSSPGGPAVAESADAPSIGTFGSSSSTVPSPSSATAGLSMRTASPSRPATRAASTPSGSKTTTAPPRSSAPANAESGQAVLKQINAWRATMGLRPYTMSPGLVVSARQHNVVMATTGCFEHQCPHEPGLGERINNQHVPWPHLIGENVAVAGGVAITTAAITNAALGLNQGMFGEKPPNDGHRWNIISPVFDRIGIDVVRASNGKVYITEDFAG